MGDGESTDHVTRRWTGVSAAALGLIAVAVLVREPGLLLAGAVAVAYAGHAGETRPPAVASDDEPTLVLGRELSERTPNPGDEVTVTVTVENRSGRLLPDVRIIDRVPDALEVTTGGPAHGTFLRAGRRSSFSYEVTATGGGHVWEPATVIVADAAGTVEREVRAGRETRLDCRPDETGATDLSLRNLTNPYAGRITTDVGGSGVQFYGVRQYRSGDPRRRIGWRHLARTGELRTVQFHRERAATVLLLLDARKDAYLAPEPGAVGAVERGVAAATRAFDALLDGGDRVGIAAFGGFDRDQGAVSAGPCWLPPGSGDAHRARGRDLLTSHPTLSPSPPESAQYAGLKSDRRAELRRQRVDRLRRRLPDDAQVVFFAPCCDEYPVTVARRLDASGHPVTVVSPDPTSTDTPGARVAALERSVRLRTLRRAGCRVVDWPVDASLVATVERAGRRWSA